jgi:hypothetical protein
MTKKELPHTILYLNCPKYRIKNNSSYKRKIPTHIQRQNYQQRSDTLREKP